MNDEATLKKPFMPPRWFVRSFWTGHRAVYRVTGGRFGLRHAKPGRWGMLRLTTIGRHSGKERNAILGYLEDGDDIVLLATNGMVEELPAWWLNLQARPDAVVDLPDGARDVHAREAVGEERQRIWDLWVDVGGGLDAEAADLEREIPVILLEPRIA